MAPSATVPVGTHQAELAERGFVRITGAFSTTEAAAMQALVWDKLGRRHGTRRDDRTSWTIPLPCGLQRITAAPVFAPIGGAPVRSAIDDLLGAGAWRAPKRWGTILVTFPVPGVWRLPHTLWHVDFSFALPAWPLAGVKMFTFLSDVPVHGGGTLVVSGSHHLVPAIRRRTRARTARANATDPPDVPRKPSLAARADGGGKLGSPHRAVHGGGAADRRRRSAGGRADGKAGDVVLTHPWLLHCRAANCATEPRFMRTTDIHRCSDASAERPDPGSQGGKHVPAPG